MAVVSRDLRSSTSQRATGYHRAITGQFQVVGSQHQRATGPLHPTYAMPALQPEKRTSWTPYIITAILAIAALVLVANSLYMWGQTKLDDLRYGRPRTTTMSGFVGHNEAGGTPSQFVAMNLNRRVVVFQIPGGDAEKTRTLTGPYLFGASEDLTPIGLSLALINDDKEPDLVVSVKHEEIIYINENGGFRLITPEERAAHQQRLEVAQTGAQPGTPSGTN
jgi:hypothetical protein